MNDGLRLGCLALYGVGPAVALRALLRRRSRPPAPRQRVTGWRRFVPPLLLPIEWLLPPVLIFFEIGELPAEWFPPRLIGLAAGLGGAALLVWAAVYLDRFFVHEASVRPDHTLVTGGPYRFVRHPVYSGYLMLLLGSAVASLNVWLLLFWPLSLLGVVVQTQTEERLLAARFGPDYERYAGRTGRLVPRLRRRTELLGAHRDGPR